MEHNGGNWLMETLHWKAIVSHYLVTGCNLQLRASCSVRITECPSGTKLAKQIRTF